MKKIAAIILAIFSCFALAGCRELANDLLGTGFVNDIWGEESIDESELEWTEISTFEELKKGGDYLKLTADIDCDYEMISGIACERFDGQGFTIKNCVVDGDFFTRSSAYSSYKIIDVTFDNVNGGCVTNSIGYKDLIENVTIRNSKNMRICWHGTEDFAAGVIKNCLVENVTIEIERTGDDDCYVGGILGKGCADISDCTVKNSTFTVTSLDRGCEVYVGGVAGHVSGTIKNCVSKNNQITVNANKMKGVLYGSHAYVGGVVGRIYGEDSMIECCGAQDNEINVSSSGTVRAGGLCATAYQATVTECYAANNILLAGDEVTDEIKLFMAMRTLGGLIGYAKEITIQSSFTIGNSCTETSKKTNENYSMAGGIIGESSSNAVSYCAALNNTLAAVVNDDFCSQKLGELFGCYISTETSGNVNACEIVVESFWRSEDTIKTKLNLLSPNWKYGGEYPHF